MTATGSPTNYAKAVQHCPAAFAPADFHAIIVETSDLIAEMVRHRMSENHNRPAGSQWVSQEGSDFQGSIIEQLLQEGISSARSGDKGNARRSFHRILALDSGNEDAWLWLAYLAPSPRESRGYFEQLLALNPDSRAAHDGIRWAEERMKEQHEGAVADEPSGEGQPDVSISTQPRTGDLPSPRSLAAGLGDLFHRWRFLLLLLAIFLASLAASFWFAKGGTALWAQLSDSPATVPTSVPTPTPSPAERASTLWFETSEAWNLEDWGKAIETLKQIREITPSDPQARTQLASAYLYSGMELVERGRVQEALPLFDRAVRLDAANQALQQARRHAIQYLAASEPYLQGDWQGAIEVLSPIFQEDPTYRDVGAMLSEAHYQIGLAHEEAEELDEAREAYQLAMVANSGNSQAQERYAFVDDIIRNRKRIEVDVSAQRFVAWENEQVVFDLVCSTGKWNSPTKYGSFKVLDKIPEAWASAWGLRMPWWLGIYWAGATENGIHALPILRNGQTLWAGYLGTPISYGCIVLDTYAAKQVYDWAEIGTIVEVYP